MPDPASEIVDLINPRSTLRNRLPGTNMFRERFFRMIRTKLFQSFRRNVQILDEFAGTIPHDEYLNQRSQFPGLYAIFELLPIRGFSIIHLSGKLTGAIVDDVFGARNMPSTTEVINAELSGMERRLGTKTAIVFADALADAYAPHFQIAPTLSRVELHTALASIADSKDPLFVLSCSVEFPCGTGEMSISIPYKGLEPFRNVLASPISGQSKHEDDAAWAQELMQSLNDVSVELAIEIGEIRTALRNVVSMKVGDLFPARIFGRARIQNQGNTIAIADFGTVGDNVGIRLCHSAERN